MDPIFGQSQCFSWDDPNVDPRVKKYLQTVRNEAISMTIMDMSNTSTKEIVNSDIYDDNKSVKANIYDLNNIETTDNKDSIDKSIVTCDTFCLDWLDQVTKTLEDISPNTITVEHLKKYCLAQTEKKGVVLHLHNMLKDVPLKQEINDLDSVRNNQILSLLQQLQRLRIPNLECLQCVLHEDYSTLEPHGFKKWNQFIKENEPCVAMFNTMITYQNIWLLIRYMTQNWLDDLVSTPKLYRKITLWLLYILVHLPRRVSPLNVSTLRSLAQKCKDLQHTQNQTLKIPNSLELSQIPMPTATVSNNSEDQQIDLTSCVLQLVAVRYQQKDLLFI